MDIQKANSVLSSDGITLDELLIAYGEIQGTIAARYAYRDLVNTNYSNEPTKGGTVRVKRMKSSVSQAYGTARTAGAGNALENNGVDVKIDTDREISEEMDAKDVKLYKEEGGLALLNSRRDEYAITMGVELEKAYFVALQNAAIANGLVTVTGGTNTEDKITLLIEALEKIENENVKGLDRENIVVTLAPVWYDSLEARLQTLPNPLNGGVNAKFFRSVEVRPALRQGFDAIAQYRGSIAQPMVMDLFRVDQPAFSNDLYTFISYYYGTKAVMPDLVLACALDADISA